MVQGPENAAEEFTAEARKERTGLAAEFIGFLAHNKKWWLLPILVALLAVALLVVAGATGAAPWIYTLM